jgi:hypothetical protein
MISYKYRTTQPVMVTILGKRLPKETHDVGSLFSLRNIYFLTVSSLHSTLEVYSIV